MKKSTLCSAVISIVIFIAAVVLTLVILSGAFVMIDGNYFTRVAAARNGAAGVSGDAACSFDKQRCVLTLETSEVRREITLADGKFVTTDYTDLVSGIRYVTPEAPQNEFSFFVSADFTGRRNVLSESGNKVFGDWTFSDYKAEKLSQGELQAEFTVSNDYFTVTKYYIVYPRTSVIQEWTEVTNTSGVLVILSLPSLFENNFGAVDGAESDFYYMTGNGNYSGASILKNIPLSSDYSRVFYSRDEPELQEIRGFFRDDCANDYMGVGIYNEFFAVHNRVRNFGFYKMFDYIGVWSNTVKFSSDRITLDGRVAMSGKTVASGESIVTPKNLTGFWQGDTDDMGNDINEYQALYKWDYSEDYTEELNDWTSRQAQWIPGRQTENAYELMQTSLSVGLSSMWIDDSWFDAASQWNETNGDDFALINEFTKKNGSRGMSVWSPIWMTYYDSDVIKQHPDWVVEKGDCGGWIGSNGGYGSHLNFARDDVYNWALAKLGSLQDRWGSYMWRYDAEAVCYTDNGDNDMLAQSNNFYRFLKDFKDANPEAGIHGCSSGGHSMTVESVRFSDMQQITDGGVGDISAYYLSMLFPACKIQGYADLKMSAWDRYLLAYTVSYNTYSPYVRISDEKLSFDRLDEIRELNEMNTYLKEKKVKSRFSKIYRPLGTDGIGKEYFLQEMDGEREKGAIFISYYPEMVGKTFAIFPKKLIPDLEYTVSSWEGGVKKVTKTGAELMADGITVEKLVPGETIFLNLEDRPGNGTDTVPPSAVDGLTVKDAEYLGYVGVQLDWQNATDDRAVSYYNIYNNGTLVNRIASGTFCFTQCGNIYDTWGVSAVDRDGNESEITTVSASGARSKDKFNFARDFMSDSRGWKAYELSTEEKTAVAWDTEYGYATAYGNQLTANTLILRKSKERIEFTAPRAGHIYIYGSVNKNRTYLSGDGVTVSVTHGHNRLASVVIGGSNHDGIGFMNDVYVLKGDIVSVTFDPRIAPSDDKLFFDLNIDYAAQNSAAQNITLGENTVYLELGETTVMPIKVTPFGAAGDIKYEVVSGVGIVNVDGKGFISPLAVGKARIKAYSASDANKAVTAEIIVYDKKQTYDYNRDFSAVQGYRNWRYVYFPNGEPHRARAMTWNTEKSAWTGTEAYAIASPDMLHPGIDNSVGAVFVSPCEGLADIAVVGKIVAKQGGDNGTVLTVYLNGDPIKRLRLDSVAEKRANSKVMLNKGDELMIAVDSVNGKNRNDSTKLSATVTFDDVSIGECVEKLDIRSSGNTKYIAVGETVTLSPVATPDISAPVVWDIVQGGECVLFDPADVTLTGLLPGTVTVQATVSDALNAVGKMTFIVYSQPTDLRFGAQTGYSSEQGKNGWRYYSYSESGGYAELMLGADGDWKAYNWLVVSGSVMHPDGDRDAVRAFECPYDGTFRIFGKVRKASNGIGGNGVAAKIYLGTECVFDTKISGSDNVGVSYDMELTVKKGDVLYFRVGSDGNDAYDGTEWLHNGRYTQLNAVSERVRRFNAKIDELAVPDEFDRSQADTVRGLFELYETFTDDEKVQASGYNKLFVIRELFNDLAASEERVKNVERLIDIYLSVHDDRISKYVDSAYAALSDVERAQVKNYESFVNGNTERSAAKRAALAEAMIGSIDLDGVTLADERTAEFITEYINGLTPQELALVPQAAIDSLSAINGKIAELKDYAAVATLKTLVAGISEICPDRDKISAALVLRDTMTEDMLNKMGRGVLEKLARLENMM